MLMTMSTLFTLCWMPLHIFFIIASYKPGWMEKISQETANILYFSVTWLALSNSFQNPIIYGFLNNNFRVCIFIISTALYGLNNRVRLYKYFVLIISLTSLKCLRQSTSCVLGGLLQDRA